MKQNKQDRDFRTYQFRIHKNNPFFSYCDTICFGTKNMYNTSLYTIRQVMSVFWKLELQNTQTQIVSVYDIKNQIVQTLDRKLPDTETMESLHLGEMLCATSANYYIQKSNETRYSKKKAKAMAEYNKSLETGTPWNPREGNVVWFEPLTENHYMTYGKLDALFKESNQADYRALPIHTAQKAIKDAVQDMENWQKSLSDWKENPGKYKGMPKMPGYKDKTGRARAVISNQSGKLLTERGNLVLQLPKLPGYNSSLKMKLKKFSVPENMQLFEVRIIPKNTFYNLELVFHIGEKPNLDDQESCRVLAVDPGEKNFAVITSNFGEAPRIIKGGEIRSLNQKWNNDMDYSLSRLYAGKDMKQYKGLTSSLLQSLTANRNSRIKDWMHKASRALVNYAVSVKADTIVIGKNKEQKQEICMGRKNNRKFVQIPFNLFNAMVQYKAEQEGIKVIFQEESNTSKSSFLDEDPIPVFNSQSEEKTSFSGKRTTRGTYRSAKGIQINADVNGSANILRKAFPEMPVTDIWRRGVRLPVQILSW